MYTNYKIDTTKNMYKLKNKYSSKLKNRHMEELKK